MEVTLHVSIRVAYADPPYIGRAGYYPEKTEVDHRELVARLANEFPDGWALSCTSTSLRFLLPLCPEDVRVLAWVKPFAAYKAGVNPAYAWEPVIARGCRRSDRKRSREEPTIRDWMCASATLKRGLVGAKPEAFSWWLFRALGLQPGDELVDLFPGTGAVTRAWEQFCANPAIGTERARAKRKDRRCVCGRETSETTCPYCGHAEETNP